MKIKFTLLLLCVSFTALVAQLKITEISYNPPESGNDSLEYIEIYNTSDAAINLDGYIIADNNEDTLSAMMIEPGGFAIAGSNAAALQNVFGVAALSIPNTFLRNGGERVAILTPAGEELDAVEYSPDAPWPTFEDGTAGEGASIELCNLEADGSNPENWRAADNGLGITIDEKELKGTPGAANTTSCEPAPDVTANSDNTFTPADITISVGESVTWANTGGFHNVNGSLDAFPDNPAGFSSGNPSADPWIFTHTFDVAGLYSYRCDPHATLGMTGTVMVMGEPEPNFPLYDVATISTNDADGQPDSLGVDAAVIGTAHGLNLRPGGLLFTLIDDNGDGIGIFSDSEDFGIAYEEGMRLRVGGTVSFFRGLTQITVAEVEVMSTGNSLATPIEITGLSEDSESQLVVTSQPLTFVDPAQWGNGNTSGFNATMVDPNGVEYNLRIDNDSPLFLSDIPETPAVVTGIGGQFDGDAPYDSGYQLAPRYIADFDPISSAQDELAADIRIYPNPATERLNIDSDVSVDWLEVTSANGQLIMSMRGATTVNVAGLDKGIYFLKVISGEKSKVIPFQK